MTGAFADGDPAFVDAPAGDLNLGPLSKAKDRIPNGEVTLSADSYGCRRPAGATASAGDIGAIQAQD